MKAKFLIPMLALLLVGCSGVKQVGQVGNVTYYRVNVRGFSGPNITTLVSETDGVVHIETAAAGGGIGHTIISSVGHVGAAAAFGLSLRPDETTVNNGSTSGSSSGSLSASTATGNGGNSSATATGNGGSSNATGGSGGAGGAGGHGGHPDSPGNGGIPGNGGQNGNGH